MESNKGQQIYLNIVEKAQNDNCFKNDLMQNPIETIENFTGEKLNVAANKKVIVQDQTDASTIYLNIPQKVNYDDKELNEQQLEIVSGGTGGVIFDVFNNTMNDLFGVGFTLRL